MGNLFAELHRRFELQAANPCLISPDGSVLSYADIDRLSGRFAAVLATRGVAPGDRVAAQIDKSAGAVALYLACLRTGAVYVPLNSAYTPAEVAHFLVDAEPRIFVCKPEAKAAFQAAASAGATLLAMGTTPTDGLWGEARAAKPIATIVESAPDDLAAIVYTSGTTGRSKGAMLTHRNLLSNALTLHRIWGFRDGDVLLHALPIFHVHGLFVALHVAMLNGSPMIFLSSFEAGEARRRLKDATVLMGVPTFYTRLLEEPRFGREDCAHMRLFISGSAPLTAQDSDRWFERTGFRILERYGMTEAGMIASNPLDGERVAGSVGFALPEVAIRIADAAGEEKPRGEIGVIEVRGPNVFRGYWRMPERTAEEFRADGYFITGDLGTMDAEGRVRIVGRAKDLIISGGYNIYPKEIESVLDVIPGVKESAVIGVPHRDLGEGVVAVLVPERDPLSQADIEAALQRIARFKHPRRFYWVRDLPRNAMGKVQKAELRARYADAYSN
jgi:malonyl-CoA/methylmalonyl-CoA synthetase